MECVDVYALEQNRPSGSAGVVIGLYPETDSRKRLLTVFPSVFLVQNLTHRCQFYHGPPVKFWQCMFLITN